MTQIFKTYVCKMLTPRQALLVYKSCYPILACPFTDSHMEPYAMNALLMLCVQVLECRGLNPLH